MIAPILRSLLLAGFSLAAVRGLAAESLESVEKLASAWINLRVETTRVDTEWREARDMMTSLADALEQRATELELRRDLAKAATAKDREELETARAKAKAAADDLARFQSRLEALSARLLALRRSLPPRLSDALELSYRTLAAKETPVSERMQVVMTVLNRCAQFNQIVTAGEEVLAIDGEADAKFFEVIYWGLSHGYALDRVGKKAWIGSPGDAGWKWQPQPDAFEAVGELLAVAGDKTDPTFVVVPAHVPRAVAAVPGPLGQP